MERSSAELEALVRNRICGVCTERTADGQCGLDDPSSCALFRLLPRVVRAIQSVDSPHIQPYIDAIRRDVCSVCGDQRADGTCEARQEVRCALDAYLMLVVDAIEDVTGKTFDRGGVGPAVGGVDLQARM